MNENLFVCFVCEDETGKNLYEFENFEGIENPACDQCGECLTIPKFYLEDMREAAISELCIEMYNKAEEEGITIAGVAFVDLDIKGMNISDKEHFYIRSQTKHSNGEELIKEYFKSLA